MPMRKKGTEKKRKRGKRKKPKLPQPRVRLAALLLVRELLRVRKAVHRGRSGDGHGHLSRVHEVAQEVELARVLVEVFLRHRVGRCEFVALLLRGR